MDNNTILNQRWKYTNNKLKEYLNTYKKISRKTQDKIQEIFNSVDYEYMDLNKPISSKKRKKLLRIVDDWKDNNLLDGYFGFKVNELIKKRYISNEDMLDILLWGTYVEERSSLDEYERTLFIDVGTDLYNQGRKEIEPKKEKRRASLTWAYIWSLLTLPNINGNKWTTYIEASLLTYAQEIKRQTMICLQQLKELNIDDDIFQNIIRKQQNKYLSINNDKYSGALENQIIEVANQSLLKAGEDTKKKNLQVRFIAELDERTTPMCESMDNMLFYVNDWNTYQRYSAGDDAIVTYKTFGLEVGANCPPINNHYHYCRSTLTYLVDMPRKELNLKLQTGNEQNAIMQWLSSDFYNINWKMYNKEPLTREEKKKVKDLYRALNKEEYYNAKENEPIVRVLELDEKQIQQVIDNHPIGKVYKSRAFESYSLKGGYNPNANVYFYVFGSKKARNMLKYNPMDREAEVLYQYGTKFVTLEHKFENGKHHFLLEEL